MGTFKFSKFNLRTTVRIMAVVGVATGGILACATAPVRMKADVFWPPIPNPTRIVYEESFWGTNYFAPPLSEDILGFLIGKEKPLTLFKPTGVAVDKNGSIYVADGLGYIMVLDLVQEKVRLIADKGQGKLSATAGVEYHSKRHEIVAADPGQKTVMVYQPETGKLLRQFGPDIFERPTGLAVNEETNQLAVIDTLAHSVKILDFVSGEPLITFGQRGSGEGDFNFPTAVAFGPDGRIFVTDTMNFRIQVFDETGVFDYEFGEIGMLPGQFSRPKGIAVDSEHHVYVIDAAFANIQVFDGETGDLLMVFGASGWGPGEFWLPFDIHITADDHIYITDQGGRRVQHFRYLTRSEGKEFVAAREAKAEAKVEEEEVDEDDSLIEGDEQADDGEEDDSDGREDEDISDVDEEGSETEADDEASDAEEDPSVDDGSESEEDAGAAEESPSESGSLLE